MHFTMEVNHGGYLVCDPILKYARGDRTLLSHKDIDNWSFFEFFWIPKKDFKIKGDFKLWWKGDDVELKELALDSHTIEVLNFGTIP